MGGPKTVDFCGFVDRCLLLGYKDDFCCPTKIPESCSDCHDLGEKCIGIHNREKQCKKLGYEKDAECPAACPTGVPTKCKDCEDIGDKCIAEGGFEKVCQRLNYGQFISGKCPIVCPEHTCPMGLVIPETCAKCEEIGQECVNKTGQSKVCKALGFRKGKCSGTCKAEQAAPSTCEQCVDLGKTCIAEIGAQETCKDMHYKKGRCVPPCVNSFHPAPAKCNQCEILGARCVKKLGLQKKCTNLDWHKKKGCPKDQE